MGFFNDLKADFVQAVNELTDENAEKELAKTEELLKEEIKDMTDEELIEAVASNSDDIDDYLKIIEENESRGIENEEIPEELSGEMVVEEIIDIAEENIVSEDEELTDLGEVEELAEIEETESFDNEDTVPEENIQEEIETQTEDLTDSEESASEDETKENISDEEPDEKPMNDELEDRIQAEIEKNFKETKGAKGIMEGTVMANDEVAKITSGTKIAGDISSEGSLEIYGTVEGNIEIYGKLNVSGTLKGNAKASEVFAEEARITGDIYSAGNIKIGQNTIVVGNLSATGAVIAGAVKGDIDVKGPVILDSSAVIVGNIKSKLVQINNGAVVEGLCSQCYADVNPESFFENM